MQTFAFYAGLTPDQSRILSNIRALRDQGGDWFTALSQADQEIVEAFERDDRPPVHPCKSPLCDD